MVKGSTSLYLSLSAVLLGFQMSAAAALDMGRHCRLDNLGGLPCVSDQCKLGAIYRPLVATLPQDVGGQLVYLQLPGFLFNIRTSLREHVCSCLHGGSTDTRFKISATTSADIPWHPDMRSGARRWCACPVAGVWPPSAGIVLLSSSWSPLSHLLARSPARQSPAQVPLSFAVFASSCRAHNVEASQPLDRT